MSEFKDDPTIQTVHLENARQPEQLSDMENIAERGICFMCPENIPEFYEERGGLIKEGDYAFLVHNGYPYENTEHHLMVIPKVHATSIAELNDGFWLETLRFLQQMEEELEITAGAVAMRFGEPRETGATAHHLHMHLLVPRKDIGPEDKPVKFRMSKSFKPADIGRMVAQPPTRD